MSRLLQKKWFYILVALLILCRYPLEMLGYEDISNKLKLYVFFPYSTPFLGYPSLKQDKKNPFQVTLIEPSGKKEEFLFLNDLWTKSYTHEKKMVLISSARALVSGHNDPLAQNIIKKFLCENREKGTRFEIAQFQWTCE